ncbi:MAG: hypothetical protein QW600_01225 [Candidatus Bathyarchaeia archaeon]
MSKLIFMLILNDVLSRNMIKVNLSENEKDRLYMELLNYFGLAGGLNVCEALENAWQDPYNRSRIEDFIIAWLKRRVRKSIISGVV